MSVLMIDPVTEYEEVAEALAEAGFLKNPVEMLKKFMNVSDETMEAIESDPHAFLIRVNDYAYGKAMRKHPTSASKSKTQRVGTEGKK